jgi:hypothetical protein
MQRGHCASSCPARPATRPYAVLSTDAILRFPLPPIADQAVRFLQRWRRCSGTRSMSRGLGAHVPRPATPSWRPEPREELRGELIEVDGDAWTASPMATSQAPIRSSA